MSLPPQVNTDKSGKHQAAAMKESVQHSGEAYYGMGPPTLESSHSDSASSSAVYNPEKGPPSLPHYQQAAPVKWVHQDSIQAPGWSQEAPVPAWGQNFGPYMGGVNVRGQMAFHKGVHEGVTLPVAVENQVPAPAEAYRDANQAPAQGRGLEWEQHAVVAMQQAQLQAYQHGHKGAELQGQAHVPPHALQGSMLQPFQSTFRPSKQQFSSGYYSVFPGNKAVPSLAYGEQQKTQQQQQLIHQLQQQKMHHHHQQQQQQQQQQLQQQHHLQMQQQQHLQQHQHHQIQHHQMQQQQQQLQHMQQYHQQHQLQGRQQQMQQMQQQQQQLQHNVPQQDATAQLQVQPKQPQTQNFAGYQSPEPCPPEVASKKEEVRSVEPQTQTCDTSAAPEPGSEKGAADPEEASDSPPAAPRRSRRLSREGQSPLGPPPTNIWSQGSKEPAASQNGVAGEKRGGESQVATGGVIQITRRRRRASKEINLETLAQTASERQKIVKEEGSSGRQNTMVPLVIPVSVPVHRSPMDPQGLWAQGRLGQGERLSAALSDRIPSVIVARRRSLRNSMTESLGQDGENDPGPDADGKSKFKRRPRPEPLIIPPPKPATFIAPSVYSSISSYQSNLRSPVRMPDHPLMLPPYTPPPILSPVREGSGLYFSTLMTSIAVSNQILPLPPTPKTATRSLLRSASSDLSPPVLPMITDVTPVSLEPRINIGQQYQADIPDLQDQLSSQFDQLKADLVWVPVENSNLKHGDQESMVDLMNMACSSVLTGGGTNQELVLHCLHECGGDFLETLGRLMLQDPSFPRGHTLAGYHYSGSDSWTAEEKRYFNKGISAYRKDFFLVQKLVQTKTVAQCVEFYYTYKKQVKIGRNSILTFGPPDSPGEKQAESVVDVKGSHQSKLALGETAGDDKKDASYDQITERDHQARVAQSLQAHDYAGTMPVIKEPDAVIKEAHRPAAHPRPRGDPAAKKPRAPPKPPQDPDAVFPCKKCGRVFNKVKSRSAHMKSHAEQEKKAAALRLKEEEEQAAAEARARKVAAAAAASTAAADNQGGNGNGVTEQVSSHEESSEGEDDNDEDWR